MNSRRSAEHRPRRIDSWIDYFGTGDASRRGAFRREELRDLGGVAAGVAAAALVSLVFLSLMRLVV